MSKGPILLNIKKEGQPYVDELIYAKPKERSELSQHVEYAFTGVWPREQQRIVVGFNRVPLKWVTPDKGKFKVKKWR